MFNISKSNGSQKTKSNIQSQRGVEASKQGLNKEAENAEISCSPTNVKSIDKEWGQDRELTHST
jgi:hypothetical protein